MSLLRAPGEPTGQQLPAQPGDDDNVNKGRPSTSNASSTSSTTPGSHVKVTSTPTLTEDITSAGSTSADQETRTAAAANAEAALRKGAEANVMGQPGVPDLLDVRVDAVAADEDVAQPAATTTLQELDDTSSSIMSNSNQIRPQSNLDSSASHPMSTPDRSDTVSSNTQFLTPEQKNYIDPTPATPFASRPPSRTPSTAAVSSSSSSGSRRSDVSPYPSLNVDTEADDKTFACEDDQEQETGSQSEIQSIMEQFSESGGGPGVDEVMSPRLELASPMLSGPVQHPPRKSSLEPLVPIQVQQQFNALQITTSSPPAGTSEDASTASIEQMAADDERGPPVPPKDGTQSAPHPSGKRASSIVTSPQSPQLSMHRKPPPEPEPEPALPFDFHRFLEQLRNKKADPVARYLKSFLFEFGKRQWMVHEQVKIISDFLAFIANKMMICEVWRDVSDAEYDNAREGMEKLVMNRLYTQTFSPAIPSPKPIPGAKPKRKGGDPPMGPGRRGQHQEDVERDDIVTQKINIYGWVKEEHLDIPPVGDSGRRFLKLAQQELLKIKSYRAPRDKIICVLNCCKVIFGLLKHNKADSSADSFMPLLIYVVLQSNPEHLVSNVQYILRFRDQEKLGGEAGYYLSSLMGAVQFIENMDRTSLTISDEEFETNVEAAVSAIAERHQAMSPKIPRPSAGDVPGPFGEKAPLEFERMRPSVDGGGPSAPRQSTSSNEDAGDDRAPISGILGAIQNPLTTIGRMFSDEGVSSSASSSSSPAQVRLPPRPPHREQPQQQQQHHPAPRRRATGREEEEEDDEARARQHNPRRHDAAKHHGVLSAEEAAARQANAEVAEAQRLHRAEHANVVETLASMFPDLDKDIISDVVYQKEGRVGLAVDACLALST